MYACTCACDATCASTPHPLMSVCAHVRVCVCRYVCKYAGRLCTHTYVFGNVCVGVCFGEGTVNLRPQRIWVLRQKERAGDSVWDVSGGCLVPVSC